MSDLQSLVRDRVLDKVGSQVWGRVMDEVGSQVHGLIRDRVQSRVLRQVFLPVWRQVRRQAEQDSFAR